MAHPALLPVVLTCNTDLRFIDLIQVVGAEFLKHLSFTQEDGERLWLAIQEGIANAMRHGNKLDPTKIVFVRYVLDEETLEVEIEDQGTGFNPEAVADPTDDFGLSIPSGRGLLLMRHYMNEVRHNTCGNCVRLSCRRGH